MTTCYIQGTILEKIDPLTAVQNCELRCFGTELKKKLEYFVRVFGRYT
jgi:hypothetical protein